MFLPGEERIILAALRSWATTFRLCLIVFVTVLAPALSLLLVKG